MPKEEILGDEQKVERLENPLPSTAFFRQVADQLAAPSSDAIKAIDVYGLLRAVCLETS